jgi:hypothetical protein
MDKLEKLLKERLECMMGVVCAYDENAMRHNYNLGRMHEVKNLLDEIEEVKKKEMRE